MSDTKIPTFPNDDPAEFWPIVLDQDHVLRPMVRHEKPWGWFEAHRKPDGSWCIGAVPRRGVVEGPAWDVLSEDPLTLSPSLLCRACGSHGFIRDGKWSDA